VRQAKFEESGRFENRANGYRVEILWHCRETGRQTEKTNINLLHREKQVYSTQKTYKMPVRREGKMKNLALIALIMVLSLSGCASSGKRGFIIQEWTEFWKGPEAAEPWKSFKQEWTEFWN